MDTTSFLDSGTGMGLGTALDIGTSVMCITTLCWYMKTMARLEHLYDGEFSPWRLDKNKNHY